MASYTMQSYHLSMKDSIVLVFEMHFLIFSLPLKKKIHKGDSGLKT